MSLPLADSPSTLSPASREPEREDAARAPAPVPRAAADCIRIACRVARQARPSASLGIDVFRRHCGRRPGAAVRLLAQRRRVCGPPWPGCLRRDGRVADLLPLFALGRHRRRQRDEGARLSRRRARGLVCLRDDDVYHAFNGKSGTTRVAA